MTGLRAQGLAFCVVAALVILGSGLASLVDEGVQLIILATLIVLLGVPHGALDTVFAEELYRVRTPLEWAGFGVLYLALAFGVVALWMWLPLAFLLGFLVISAIHFSGDLADGTAAASRAFYGGAVVVLPMMWHADEVSRLFAILVGNESAAALGMWLGPLAGPWLGGLVLMAGWSARRDWLTGLEMVAVGGLALCAAPLVAFTVFFCGMHSARHIGRTLEFSQQGDRRKVLMAGLWPMLGVVGLVGVGSFWWREIPWEARVIQVVFVGLAALTVPHMALVERVRFTGWTPR